LNLRLTAAPYSFLKPTSASAPIEKSPGFTNCDVSKTLVCPMDIVTAIAAFVVIIGLSTVFQIVGVNAEEAGNIKDLELYFSLPSILLLSAFQPIAEEIFFRGFLLEKLGSLFGNNISILVTSVLFGLAHLSQGNVIPAIMTGLIGVLLAYIVLKTKNLYAGITAHILFNVTSVTLYIIGKMVLTEALIL